MQGKVEISGVSTSSLKVLKNAEMTQLLRKVKRGDQQARQQMIEGNLRAGAVRDPALRGPGREYGRSVSDRLHRPV